MKDKKDNIYGIIGTIVFHLFIILILLFTGLTTPFPPPPELGVEVNLGNSDQGKGQIQPDKAAQSTEQVVEEIQDTEDAQEEIREHNAGEGPKIASKKKIIEKPKKKPEPEKPKPQINTKAMFKGNKQKTEEGGNEGITGKPGDQGDPFGSPTATNYKGGGSGSGIQFDLGGRTKIKIPAPRKTFTKEGTVVVTIYVDKYGKVTRAIPGARGSDTTNPELIKLAKEAALKATFNADQEASIEQKGIITYHFVLKN